MSKYVYINRVLFVVGACLTFALFCETASAKIYTLGGKVLPRTEEKTAVPGLDAREMKLMFADFLAKDLTDADFAGADLRRADFAGADLSGVNFIGADLRGVNFSGAVLDGANLSQADLRGAVGFQAGRDMITANTILPNGMIRNLNLSRGKTLVVRNYDAVRPPRGTEGYAGKITLVGSAVIDGGTLVFVVDNQKWNSTIQTAPGVVPAFKNVEVRYEKAHDFVTSDLKIQAFSWAPSLEVVAMN